MARREIDTGPPEGPRFVQVIPEALEDLFARHHLGPQEKLIVYSLLNLVDYKTDIWKGTSTDLAQYTGLAPKTVRAAMELLTDAGVIVREFPRGHVGWVRLEVYEDVVRLAPQVQRARQKRRNTSASGCPSPAATADRPERFGRSALDNSQSAGGVSGRSGQSSGATCAFAPSDDVDRVRSPSSSGERWSAEARQRSQVDSSQGQGTTGPRARAADFSSTARTTDEEEATEDMCVSPEVSDHLLEAAPPLDAEWLKAVADGGEPVEDDELYDDVTEPAAEPFVAPGAEHRAPEDFGSRRTIGAFRQSREVNRPTEPEGPEPLAPPMTSLSEKSAAPAGLLKLLAHVEALAAGRERTSTPATASVDHPKGGPDAL